MCIEFRTRIACLGLAVLLSLVMAMPSGAVEVELIKQRRPAKALSAYGFFEDLTQQTPATGVVPYDLQVPLFTDYAEKYRFAYVPDGQTAIYDDSEAFRFPVGSALIKTFAYPADFRNPDTNIRLIETRLLLRQEKGWNAWTYVWNDEQTDAVLKVAGTMTPVAFVDASGAEKEINYIVPNKNQCKGCHSFNGEFTPIGPKARNLNKDYDYKNGAQNQLEHWHQEGLLNAVTPTPPSMPDMFDASADLNDRARAYLDINCAHCHRAEGPASTSGLFLTYAEDNPTAWGYEKRPVAAGRGSGGFLYDIAPGNADQSILYHRMQSVDPAVMMPEVGRTTVHTEGLSLIREWINNLD